MATKQLRVPDPLLFREEDLLPARPLRLNELKPSQRLLTVFEACHNYIYANEGLLKERIFHEIVKLLLMKLIDERRDPAALAEFMITAGEYAELKAGGETPLLPRIDRLFAAAKREHPRLFVDDKRMALRPLTLAYVVAQLQPISLLRTPGDAKGEAFQTFVYRHQRGDRGEYFTPHPIVRLAVEMIHPQATETLIDPACGSAGFLIQAIDHVARSSDDRFSRAAYIRDHVRGIEFNPDIARAATVRIAFEGGEGEEVFCADALRPVDRIEQEYDVILTNPPFGSKGKIEDPAILQRFELAHKWTKRDEGWVKTAALLPGQTPDVLFLERCVTLLRAGGRMAIVLPDGLLQNVSMGYVRAWLLRHAHVFAVVSVPQEAFVPYGTGIKTSVLFVSRRPLNSEPWPFMARVRKLGYDVKGQPLYQKDGRGRLLLNSHREPLVDDDVDSLASAYHNFSHKGALDQSDDAFSTDPDLLNSRLDVEHYLPSDRCLIDQLRAANARPLGQLAEIISDSDDFRLAGDEDIRYIAISDIDSRTMRVVNQQSMKAHEAPSRATYRLRSGDIVTAVSGASTGTTKQATALITADEDGAICSNGLAVLRRFEGIDPLFLLCFMRTEPFLRQVRRLMTGHAIPAISLDDLGGVLIPVPPTEHQHRIANAVRGVHVLREQIVRATEQIVRDVETMIPCDLKPSGA